MPVLAPDLVQRIRTKVEAGWSQIGPRQNTSYYLDMTNAIGVGIAESINVAGFITVDEGLSSSPLIPGPGLGQGIRPDRGTLAKEIYSRIRAKSQAYAETMGSYTGHPIWNRPYTIPENYLEEFSPPDINALFILAKGIAESVYECFSTQIILTSTHSRIYFGEGIVESYTNIDASLISGKIFSNSSTLQGIMWPQICDAIGEALDFTLQNDTEAQVVITGSCSSGSGQACGIPSTGAGIGNVG